MIIHKNSVMNIFPLGNRILILDFDFFDFYLSFYNKNSGLTSFAHIKTNIVICPTDNYLYHDSRLKTVELMGK